MPCWPIPTSSQDKTAQHSARSTEAWEVQSGDMVFFHGNLLGKWWFHHETWWFNGIWMGCLAMSSLWCVFTGQIFNTLQSMGHFHSFSIFFHSYDRLPEGETNQHEFPAGFHQRGRLLMGDSRISKGPGRWSPAFPILWRSLSDCKWLKVYFFLANHKHIDPYLISYGSIMIYNDLYVSWATQFWPMPGRNSSWSARAASWTSPKEPFLSSDVAEVGEVGVINSEETAGVVDDFDWCWFLVDFIVITCIIIYTYI